MIADKISSQPHFDGNIILKNKLSKSQNYLFNLHKPALEQKIKDLPFDLFVEQSKSKKTISLRTNVEGADEFVVLKNKQNFEEIADLAISDGMKKSKIYQKHLKINEIFEYQKSLMLNVLFGKFKEARIVEKELAKIGIENFDAYKEIPRLNIVNPHPQIWKAALVNGIKYRVYRTFSPKTPEEKTFLKMKKEYLKELKAKNEKIKTVNIQIPNYEL